jgi:uncharacterized protein (DUF1810 family)
MKKITGVALVEGIIQADPFNLGRFIRAQQEVYSDALAELRGGRKRTHWMWFIFPQIEGLGHSASSIKYAIKSVEEARHYLAHPILGKRLLECANTVFAIKGRTISEIFGFLMIENFNPA